MPQWPSSISCACFARSAAGNVVSVGFIEVDDKRVSLKDYTEVSEREFDLVWFSGRASRADPCADIRFNTNR